MPSPTHTRKRRIADHLLDVARTLNLYKLSQGCLDCGYREAPEALHFDHRDPSTKTPEMGWVRGGDRSRLTTRAKFERYFEHVQRFCDVRCANCHAVRTFKEKHHLGESSGVKQPAMPTLF